MPKLTQSGLCWLWVTVLVLTLDRFTKLFAEDYLRFSEPVPITPGFNLMLSYNKGAAFSFLQSMPGQTWVFGTIALLVSGGLLIWLFRLPRKEYWLCIALTLIVGGALGNLWDRFSYGHVIDFIQLYISHFYWPVFNIADSAVCVGAVMLFLTSLGGKKKNG